MDFNRDADMAAPVFSEPNMMSLVDVMLVLVIILMVTSPLAIESIEMDVEISRAQGDVPEQERFVELVISGAGRYQWQGQNISLATLTDNLGQFQQQYPHHQLRLIGVNKVPYQEVYKIMLLAQQQDITQIQFSRAVATN